MIRRMEQRVLAISQLVQRVATGIAVAAKAARVAEVVEPIAGFADGSRLFKIPAVYRRKAEDPVSFHGDIELVSGSGQRITARAVDQQTGELAELAQARNKISELEAEVRRYEQAHERGLGMWKRSRDAAADRVGGLAPSAIGKLPRRSELVVWLLGQIDDAQRAERKHLEEATAAYETACRERSVAQQQLEELRSKYDELKHDRDDFVEAIEGRDEARMIAKFATPLMRAGDLLGKVGALADVPDAIATLQAEIVRTRHDLDVAKSERSKLQVELEQVKRDRGSFADLGKRMAANPVEFGSPIPDLKGATGTPAATASFMFENGVLRSSGIDKAREQFAVAGIGFGPGARYMMLCLQLRDLDRMHLGETWLADAVMEEAEVLWREPAVRSFVDDDQPRHAGDWEPKFERGDSHTRLRDLLARAVRTHEERIDAG